VLNLLHKNNNFCSNKETPIKSGLRPPKSLRKSFMAAAQRKSGPPNLTGAMAIISLMNRPAKATSAIE
jgi:hypothetical protein